MTCDGTWHEETLQSSSVRASELPHSRGYAFQRGVVVIGVDEQAVHVVDAAFRSNPIPVPTDDFLLG